MNLTVLIHKIFAIFVIVQNVLWNFLMIVMIHIFGNVMMGRAFNVSIFVMVQITMAIT